MNIKEMQEKLQAPFGDNDLEWKPQRIGMNGATPYVLPVPYVQARAGQRRLDEVFGINGWQTEFRTIAKDKDIVCKISCFFDGSGWVSKEDGATETNIESFKGGLSSAFKRAASSGWGIGRYLYDFEAKFAECTTASKHGNGWNKSYDKTSKQDIYWKTPTIGAKQQVRPEHTAPKAKVETSSTEGFKCSDCGASITEKIYNFSTDKHGKALCFKCQKK